MVRVGPAPDLACAAQPGSPAGCGDEPSVAVAVAGQPVEEHSGSVLYLLESLL